MPRGVPENEVLAAADRVLARGERPTVERVRAELGRGSPARVGKLLEAWWDALAKRLAGEARLPDLPPAVAVAFRSVWEAAAEQGRTTAEQSVAAERQQLATEREALRLEGEQATASVAASKAQLTEVVRQAELATARTHELERLDQQQSAQIADLQAQRDGLQCHSDQLDAALATLRAAKDAQVAAREAERKQEMERNRAFEDRAHAEIDRARQESKVLQRQIVQLQARLRTAERTLAAGARREAALQVKLRTVLSKASKRLGTSSRGRQDKKKRNGKLRHAVQT